MLSCTKEFTLTVGNCAPATTVYGYFKCNEPTPILTLNNSVDAFHLSGALEGQSVPGILSTAVQLKPLSGGGYVSFASGWTTHWMLGTDYTVRFWVKTDVLSLYPETLITAFPPGARQFMVSINDYLGADSYLTIDVDTTPGSLTVDLPSMTIGTWNHVMFWFESGVGLRAQLNGGTIIEDLAAGVANTIATSSLEVVGNSTNRTDSVDEIAIWKRILTPAERAYDFNGGVGRTYPNIP